VDPPNDGNNLSFDRGDGNTNTSDNNTSVNVPPYDSRLPASPNFPQQPPAIKQWLWEVREFILDNYPIEGLILPGVPQILEVSAATHMLLIDSRNYNIVMHAKVDKCLYKIKERVIVLKPTNTSCLTDLTAR
jgi:hypothetical protein